jgi:predicted metalloprotease
MKRLVIPIAVLAVLGVGGLSTARAFDGGSEPQTMEQFLTAVTQDVDAYWTRTFEAADLPEPRVTYQWIPAGQTAASACDGGQGMGDGAAAYCPSDDTIYISERFASGFGNEIGDFAVAFIVAHEYGHQIQDELGLFERGLPTVTLELQADCFAGTWARSAENRLEEGDIQEALDTALAVGDYETGAAGHHGTPEQRKEAWTRGFEAGDPAVCSV